MTSEQLELLIELIQAKVEQLSDMIAGYRTNSGETNRLIELLRASTKEQHD